ncbi:MAG TPA: tetratricopeptide repeat protein [Anaeromyxobacteraceae bacterium]|nr:tetratricopeptide repeat protein [Anaeromyxobacteraceae bacterium]
MRLFRLAAAAALLACAHGPNRKERQAAEAHHDLGVEAMKAGRASDALREFEDSLRIDPGFAEAHRGRGLVLEFGHGRLAEAEREYRRALDLRSSYPEVHNDLGQLLAKTGRYEEALREFAMALDDTSYREPFVARCNRGQALHAMGRREEGLAEIRACVSMAPRYCAGRRELGRIHLAEGRVKEAAEELSAYARLCDKVADAHYQLGLAHMKGGDVGLARASFERCEQLGEGTPVGEDCRRSRELLQ